MGAWRKIVRRGNFILFNYFRLLVAPLSTSSANKTLAAMEENRRRTSSQISLLKSAPVHYNASHQRLETALLQAAKEIIPTMLETAHKGQAGRIGVIGGCQEYTGAPYFAAISALRTGADLTHVFCTSDSASVIKSYSPELIVHPLLDRTFAVNEISEWLPRLQSLVIGPGLGRNPTNVENAKRIIEKARKQDKNLIIDADGMFVVTSYPDVIKGYTKTILTPNIVEFARLYTTVMGKVPDSNGKSDEQVSELSEALGHVTICKKGHYDVISDGRTVALCSVAGSNRRCGGQGDLLSGSMGTFLHWATMRNDKNGAKALLGDTPPNTTIVAAYAACGLTRTCNRLAYSRLKRSMMTSDMIEEIHVAFEELFGRE